MPTEADGTGSRNATIEELRRGARAAVAAVTAKVARINLPITRAIGERLPPSDTQMRTIGKSLLDHWHEPPTMARKPGGKIAHEVAPLEDLAALGWRFVPIPAVTERAELLAPSISYFHSEWLAIPPSACDVPARRFRGSGQAQRWATQVAGIGPAALPSKPSA